VKRIVVVLSILIAFILVGAALTLFGIWIPNYPSRSAFPVRGVDISHHQGAIRWNQISSSEVHFAYIKATEGADFHDNDFAQNWSEAKKAGIAVGAYHFYTLGTPGRRQAANFIATVPIDSTALPPAIDLEISGYNRTHTEAVPEFQRELSAFIAAVSAHFRKTPVIYTTSDFQKDYLSGLALDRFWIREVIVKPRTTWSLWQFSARGRVRGVRGFVDLNVFRGTRAEFEEFRASSLP
jgi:lysozyme